MLPRIRGALPRILREFCRELSEQYQAHAENTENYVSVSRYVEVGTYYILRARAHARRYAYRILGILGIHAKPLK